MKSPTSWATSAATLSILHSKDPVALEKTFQHLTAESLDRLDRQFHEIQHLPQPATDASRILLPSSSSAAAAAATSLTSDRSIDDNNMVIAKAIIRRIVHRCLDKYSTISPHGTVEDALKHHTLPEELQRQLTIKTHDNFPRPPKTWFDALQQLREKHKIHKDSKNESNNEKNDRNGTNRDIEEASKALIDLWREVLEHPITSYVPMQCQSCGHTVPDDLRSTATDEDLGLAEVDPTPDEAPFVRSGWFRGPRPASKVLQLDCPICGERSRWFRSRHPHIILNPNRWGRLCGEQEDLRLDLASYLGVSIRTCLPLDWDHVWSEFSVDNIANATQISENVQEDDRWNLHSNNDRNFGVRLDEGIGSFTYVWAISPNPDWCGDVTQSYLSCQNDDPPGRAEDHFRSKMERYRHVIDETRLDRSGQSTQSGTVYGYAIHRAGLTSDEITSEMKRAANEYGIRPWYQILPS